MSAVAGWTIGQDQWTYTYCQAGGMCASHTGMALSEVVTAGIHYCTKKLEQGENEIALIIILMKSDILEFNNAFGLSLSCAIYMLYGNAKNSMVHYILSGFKALILCYVPGLCGRVSFLEIRARQGNSTTFTK